MEKRNVIFWTALFIFIIGIAVLVSININYLHTHFKNYIQAYGFPAVFLLSLVTEAVDQPIGSDTISGFGLAFGLNAIIIFILCITSSWISCSINFYIGRKYLSKRIEQSCSTDVRYIKYCKFFNKYGKYALTFGALIFPFVIFIWLAGAFQMKYKTFFLYALVARVLRIGFVMLLVLGIINLHIFGM